MLVCCILLFLCPVRAQAQSYTGTASDMVYGYYNGSNSLYLFSEWFYASGGSGSYQWSVNCIKFDLTVTKYYSLAHYQSNNAISTNTTALTCGNGEWMVQQWNQSTVRVSGAKYISLEEGYYYSLSLAPSVHGNYKIGYYGSWTPFTWDGESQTAQVDLTYPE